MTKTVSDLSGLWSIGRVGGKGDWTGYCYVCKWTIRAPQAQAREKTRNHIVKSHPKKVRNE